jgi:hypothetical protein
MMESSAAVAHRAPQPALDPRRWKALALLCGAFFMVVLDAKWIGRSVLAVGGVSTGKHPKLR